MGRKIRKQLNFLVGRNTVFWDGWKNDPSIKDHTWIHNVKKRNLWPFLFDFHILEKYHQSKVISNIQGTFQDQAVFQKQNWEFFSIRIRFIVSSSETNLFLEQITIALCTNVLMRPIFLSLELKEFQRM